MPKKRENRLEPEYEAASGATNSDLILPDPASRRHYFHEQLNQVPQQLPHDEIAAHRHIMGDSSTRRAFYKGMTTGYESGHKDGYQSGYRDASEDKAHENPVIQDSVARIFSAPDPRFWGEIGARANTLARHLKDSQKRSLGPECPHEECDDWARGYEYHERQDHSSNKIDTRPDSCSGNFEAGGDAA